MSEKIKPEYMQNREVSWLRFNDRVLAEADQEDVEVYERYKFVSIFTSNLDEFFMIRIGSLHDLSLLKKPHPDSKTGMLPQEQINEVLNMLPKMYSRKDELYKKITRELSTYNINEYNFLQLNSKQKKYVHDYYLENIKPILSPQIIDKQHPFPFLENLALKIFIEFEREEKTYFGVVPIPDTIKKFLLFPGESIDFILPEKIIYHYVDNLFEGYSVKSKAIICVTRNFDLDADAEFEDELEDYKDKMKMVLKKRKRQAAVRLESNQKLTKNMKNFLLENLELSNESYFFVDSPLKMKYVHELLDIIPSAKKEKILYPKFYPYYLNFPKSNSLIDKFEKKDLLLSYPYDDMQTFIDLLKEAAYDSRVLSIKITIYRLAKNSQIAKYLSRAAENGKDVTVFMELKARFDEENNINYANILYQAGCKIIYGFERFKVHSKVLQITYKNKRDEYMYITQIGTGNYNESTSEIYADFSLITGNREIGLDTLDFFNHMSVGNLNGKYEHLVQSPSSLKDKFLKLIDEEIKKGDDGFLFFKMNSFTDKDFIQKISEASQNGVKVYLIIRGICCILPNVKGYTDNVEVRSIVGRFLEHARVFQFGKGNDAKLYIGSADLMTRNTEQRVEIACPVLDEDIQKVIQNYISKQLHDNVKGRIMNSNGEFEFVVDNNDKFSSQDYFIQQAVEKRNIQLDKSNLNENKKIFSMDKLRSFFKK
ncbi:polyphosphate kinase 1 [Peptostreptococcus faecalis]|uniref:polyphosphate kinase 1 n=1 Tax=Peptostreptococcus faecalis TaxID=2045015 RepID=UPI001A9A3DAC|nr:polyphosphate kinase 1 [Peptostreptococcus faecalis]